MLAAAAARQTQQTLIDACLPTWATAGFPRLLNLIWAPSLWARGALQALLAGILRVGTMATLPLRERAMHGV
jgi:hypothetical protein